MLQGYFGDDNKQVCNCAQVGVLANHFRVMCSLDKVWQCSSLTDPLPLACPSGVAKVTLKHLSCTASCSMLTQAYHFDVTMHPMRRPRPGEDEAMASAPSLQDRPPPVEMTRCHPSSGMCLWIVTRLYKLLRV